MSILVIKYFPILNDKLDTTNVIKDTYGEYNFTLEDIRSKTNTLTSEIINVLEEGSRYHGYKDIKTKPYLQYETIDTIEFLSDLPFSQKKYNNLPLPDYNSIMNKVNICDYVDNKGVKEVWLWTYGGTGKSGWESNFSSTYGDISNSNQDPQDLPVCNHSYTVYDYNYGRGTSEAVEDHIHQIEAIFKYLDYGLFWEKYVGYFPGGDWVISETKDTARRCGWAHYPPNGEIDYDWSNKAYFTSDCEDWQPDGKGKKQAINCEQWGCNSLRYFEWWMQNIPGENNNLDFNGMKLRNWWDFIADFDKAVEQGTKLTQ